MKHLFALLFTSVICSTITAQQINIPPVSGTGASLDAAIPIIAKQVIPLYQEADKAVYWDNLFRYKMAALDYAGAVQGIDSVIDAFKQDSWAGNPALGIQFRSYALAKMNAAAGFEKIYADTLSAVYNRLPEAARSYAAQFFGTDTSTLYSSLAALVKEMKDTGSISLQTARTLLRTYNSWNVLRQIQLPAKKFFDTEDDKKYIISENMLLPGSKGAKLSAIIVRNRQSTAAAPVIIQYNIYAGAADKTTAKLAAEKGYVGIVINTRGKQNSTDAIEPFEHDAADIYEALDWISKQPWCNGKAGMYGGSYLGFSQWSAAKKMHPLLKTIVPQVSVGIGIDYPMHNGIFMSYMLQWIHFVTNNKTTDYPEFSDKAKWDSLFTRWYRSGKPFRTLDSMEGRPNAIFQRWLQHPQYDSYWQSMVPFEKEFSRINIPVLTTTGYFDDDQRGAFYYFMQHHRWNKNARHYLLIGPYNHAGAQSAAAPEVSGYTIDSAANINIDELVFQWFDHILRDSAKPALLQDRINYQVMGTNTWKHAPSLSAVSNDALSYYLSDVFSGDAFKLTTALPAQKKFITQETDLVSRNDIDLREIKYLDSTVHGANKLRFVSSPLQQDMVMTGAITGELHFITNKKDLDISIELYEWMPDGRYFLLSNSVQRSSFIKNPQQKTLLQPGKEEHLPVYNAFFTSKKISRGSRLVVLAGINKNPNWQLNYGTGKDVSTESIADGKEPVLIQWSNRSYIKIPISR